MAFLIQLFCLHLQVAAVVSNKAILQYCSFWKMTCLMASIGNTCTMMAPIKDSSVLVVKRRLDHVLLIPLIATSCMKIDYWVCQGTIIGFWSKKLLLWFLLKLDILTWSNIDFTSMSCSCSFLKDLQHYEQ